MTKYLLNINPEILMDLPLIHANTAILGQVHLLARLVAEYNFQISPQSMAIEKFIHYKMQNAFTVTEKPNGELAIFLSEAPATGSIGYVGFLEKVHHTNRIR